MAETRILLVEDEDIVAGEIQSVLKHVGYTDIQRAVSGDEAVARVEAAPPSLILMDISLQGSSDGIDTAERIRARWDIPIIYLTAHDDDHTMQQAKVTDPFGYIVKPFKQRELHIAIEMALYRHRTEQQLRDLNAQLHEASRHKSDFLANMSHELRTPLNAMIGYTSLTLNALKNTLSAEHVQNLTRAEQSARVLLQLINDVLDFSKIEAGRLETFIEDVDLEELLDDVIMTAEGLLPDNDVELIEDFAPDLPMIQSDFTRLKQILDNLVGNAIKFTEHGHVALRAHRLPDQADGAGEMIELQVEDTGCGMSPEILDHIFELFRQADGSIKKKFSGTGLGLAISKRLSEMLGIAIDVTSEYEQGTCFRLCVPVAFRSHEVGEVPPPAAPSRPPATESDSARPAPQRPPAPSPAPETPEIHALVLAMKGALSSENSVKRQLAGFPLDIVPVDSLEACRQSAAKQPVWAILLKSDEQGFQMLADLKGDPALKDVPVILTSPQGDRHGDYVDSVDYLEKPVEHTMLLNTVLRVTRVARGRILVVDDDPSVREIYDQVLTHAGYTVQTAGGGPEALNLLQEQSDFRAILLDLMMPRMNGFQVLEHIQQHPDWRRIPVVVVTARTLSEEDRHTLRRGTDLLERKEGFSVQGVDRPVTSIRQAIALAGARSILVVDDNEMNLNLMSGVFKTSGYTVYEATSAEQGLELARHARPDTIVMDLAMPDMDGFEATEILKRDPDTEAITVIACSAFATSEYKERALRVGCEGYITKPIEPNRLVEQVTRLILNSKIQKKMRQMPTA